MSGPHGRVGASRRFGSNDDRVTRHPAGAQAVADACKAPLGGGTLSGMMREWSKAGLVPPHAETRRATQELAAGLP